MRFILRRLGFYLVAFWVSVTLNFLLPRYMPGDPVSRMMSQSQGRMTPEQLEQMRQLLGVDDRPIWQQYLSYWHSIFTGDLGVSISRFPTPVSEVIAGQIGWTLLLGGTALLVAVVLGNLLGILAAWRRGGILDSVLPPAAGVHRVLPLLLAGDGRAVPVRRHARLVPAAARVHRGTDALVLRRVHLRRRGAPRAAGQHDRAGLDRRLDARHAQHDDRHQLRGLHRDGGGEGPAPRRGSCSGTPPATRLFPL